MHATRVRVPAILLAMFVAALDRTGTAARPAAAQSVIPEVPSHLVWFDRSGKRLSVVDSAANERGLELSPDGKRASVTMLTSARNTRDIWIVDIASGSRTRFTDDGGDKLFSIWSPDGKRIVFDRDRGRGDGVRDLYQKPSSGTGEETLLYGDGRPKWPLSFSSDDKFLAFVTYNPQTGQDIEVLPLSGNDRRPIKFEQIDTTTESYPRFSPDGHWIAFGSDQDVFVAPFPGQGRRWQVSSGGGLWPRWRRDGKELFFVANKTLMAAEITAQGGSVIVGQVKPLFDIEPVIGGFYSYDVSADGQRFLVNTAITSQTASPRSTLALLAPLTVWPPEISRGR